MYHLKQAWVCIFLTGLDVLCSTVSDKMETESDSKKSHRKRQAGPKAEKKKAKTKHEQDLTPQQRNPKAFAFHSVNKVAKQVRRCVTYIYITTVR